MLFVMLMLAEVEGPLFSFLRLSSWASSFRVLFSKRSSCILWFAAFNAASCPSPISTAEGDIPSDYRYLHFDMWRLTLFCRPLAPRFPHGHLRSDICGGGVDSRPEFDTVCCNKNKTDSIFIFLFWHDEMIHHIFCTAFVPPPVVEFCGDISYHIISYHVIAYHIISCRVVADPHQKVRKNWQNWQKTTKTTKTAKTNQNYQNPLKKHQKESQQRWSAHSHEPPTHTHGPNTPQGYSTDAQQKEESENNSCTLSSRVGVFRFDAARTEKVGKHNAQPTREARYGDSRWQSGCSRLCQDGRRRFSSSFIHGEPSEPLPTPTPPPPRHRHQLTKAVCERALCITQSLSALSRTIGFPGTHNHRLLRW